MVMSAPQEEVNFPRGGVESQVSKLLPKHQTITSIKKRQANFLSFGSEETVPLKKKFKDDLNTGNFDDETDETNQSTLFKSVLKSDLCTPGLIALGVVKKIYEDHALLELSDGRSGRLKAENISKQYRKHIMKCVKHNKPLTPLNDLLTVGQSLICIVIKDDTENQSKHIREQVAVSTDPSQVNSCLLAGSLSRGSLIACSVVDIEDKGYAMDTGISSLVSFLPSSETDVSLLIGQPLICYINQAPNSNNRVVKLSAKKKKLNSSIDGEGQSILLDQLMPGKIVEGAVEKYTPRGCVVRLSPSILGFIPLRMLPPKQRKTCVSNKSGITPTDIELKVVVTFWKPNSSVLGLAAASHLLNISDISSRTQILSQFKLGDVIEATVKQVSVKGTVFLTVGKDTWCIASKDHLNLGEIEAENPNIYEFVESHYPLGKECKVRVIGHSLFDRSLFVSCRSDVFKQKIVAAEQATYAIKLTVKIEKVTDVCLFGTVYGRIACRIPAIHVTDTLPKKLTNIVKVGQKLKSRVLDIDIEKNRLVMTCKPSLVESDSKIVAHTEDIHMDDELYGVVVHMTDKGVLLSFYGDAKAYCPLRAIENAGLSLALITLGQIMKVKVFNIDANNGNVMVAPVVEVKQEHNLKVGVVYKGVVLENRCDEGKGGILLSVAPNAVQVWLPELQLSDCSLDEIGFDLAHSYKKGDVIDGLTLLSLHGPCPIVSSKVLLSEKVSPCSRFEGLSKDMSLVGSIHHINEKLGYFVQFASDTEQLIGLASFQQADRGQALQIGQTVVAKVTHVDMAKKRFNVQLKDVACSSSTPYKLLKQALMSRERSRLSYGISIDKSLQSLSELLLGQILRIKLDRTTSIGSICTMVDESCNVKGIVTAAYMDTDMVAGQEGPGLVVYVDYQNKCVELNTQKNVISRAKRWNKTKHKQKMFPIGEICSAQILAIKKDLCVVQLSLGGTPGPLAYLSSRNHPNTPFGVADETLAPNIVIDNVVVKDKLVDGTPIVIRHSVRPSSNAISIGDIVQASVVDRCSVARGGPQFIFLSLPCGEYGRLHCSEISDKFEQGSSPVQCIISKYQNINDSHVQVRIIGHHTFRTTSIEKQPTKVKYYECSTKPSKFGTDRKAHKKWLGYAQNILVGSILPVFVQEVIKDGVKVCVNPFWDGFIPKSYVPEHILENMATGQVYTARVLTKERHNVVLTMKTDHFKLDTIDLALTCVKKDLEANLPDTLDHVLDEGDAEMSFEDIIQEPNITTEAHKDTDLPNVVDGNVDFEWKPEKYSLDRLLHVGMDETDIDAQLPVIKIEDQEEDDLMTTKHSLMDGEKTEEEFDKELLGSPNSSKMWISFMAFFIQRGNLIKARSVAEKALRTINYREEFELRNIWVAYLNLENAYGDAESIKRVLDRAVKSSDDKVINKQLVKIYEKTKKYEKASSLLENMVRKYRDDFEVWVMAGQHELNHGTADKARDYMHKAIKSLPPIQHVKVLSRFAQLEFECIKGDKERGKTLFENILASYAKRVDLWLVYIDMVTKYCAPEQARPVFERATALKLSSQKMRSIYKKWIVFEERHGNAKLVQLVKDKAAVFIDHIKEIMNDD